MNPKGAFYHSGEILNRDGFDLLEGKFADSTGDMPISIWSTNIQPVVNAGDKCFNNNQL